MRQYNLKELSHRILLRLKIGWAYSQCARLYRCSSGSSKARELNFNLRCRVSWSLACAAGDRAACIGLTAEQLRSNISLPCSAGCVQADCWALGFCCVSRNWTWGDHRSDTCCQLVFNKYSATNVISATVVACVYKAPRATFLRRILYSGSLMHAISAVRCPSLRLPARGAEKQYFRHVCQLFAASFIMSWAYRMHVRYLAKKKEGKKMPLTCRGAYRQRASVATVPMGLFFGASSLVHLPSAGCVCVTDHSRSCAET